MNSLSYIIDGSRLSAQDLPIISGAFDQKRVDAPATEILIYDMNTIGVDDISSSRRLQLFQKDPSSPSLRQAVASASGDLLVFTTLENIQKHKHAIDTLLKEIPLFAAIAGTDTPATKTQKITHRLIHNSPFVAFNKMFYIDNTGYKKELAALLKIADKKLLLDILQTKSIQTDSHVIKRLKIYRPYDSLAKDRVVRIAKILQDNASQRRAEKLRKQVAPVRFKTDIPVFVICRDRLEPLKKLVSWLEDEGMTNIIFIDNHSTYKPLLDYFETTRHTVLRLNKNAGHTAPWSEGIVKLYASERPFIVTDPDIIPCDESHGAIRFFCDLLNKYPERTKVGFGLKIDDLPDSYDQKTHVIAWEEQFWESLVEPNVYDAEIDTTFALYRRNTPYVHGPGLRTGGKYLAQHEPWYIDSNHPSKEILYYREHASKEIGTWGITTQEVSRVYEKSRRSKR